MTSDIAEKPAINAESILELQATLLANTNFEESTTAFVSEIALKLGLERVSIGIIEHRQTEIKAVSHSTEIESKHEINRRLASAMDEAINQSAVITHPEIAGSLPRLMLAHAALIKGSNHHACTIPLINNGDIFGAMTFEQSNTLFRKEEISTLENITTLFGPILFLKWRDSRPWYRHIRQDCKTWLQRHFREEDGKFKLGVYALGLLLIGALFIPLQHNVSAIARIEGSIQRALVAPENGYLQHAYVRAGDKVKAGQVLAELADEELQLEIRRWQSELAQHENTYNSALAQSDRVQMVVNGSKAEEARTQLALAEQKLSRTHITAPFDGVIIKGDLKQLLGAPVQRGDTLLTIAPIESFRLMIEVDERDISEVTLKQAGKVALISLPGNAIPFEVLSITPAAVTKEERNFFEVEGKLKATNAITLRPGLEGIAKIQAGKRPLIWVLSHRVIDWAKITLWKWGL
jgi:RND family efflux transporter MFP subunit